MDFISKVGQSYPGSSRPYIDGVNQSKDKGSEVIPVEHASWWLNNTSGSIKDDVNISTTH